MYRNENPAARKIAHSSVFMYNNGGHIKYLARVFFTKVPMLKECHFGKMKL